ncbi:MAG: ubiquinol-cytochrome C chaperone family protein [Rhizomicrobium sp.]|nr:ubiquinol-cytochrome C chaperone family protein [Rhizomicrobium sp.]
MLNLFSRCKTLKSNADRLYAAVVTRAREPVFFVKFAVPDTIDGRFDLLTLHAWLLLAHLQTDPAAAALAQAFVDRLFIGFDEALREQGGGDVGMGRRMKKFAAAFYGRLKAYDEAQDHAAMEKALTRNLYRGVEEAAAGAMAVYVLGAKQHLSLTPEGVVDFGALPV